MTDQLDLNKTYHAILNAARNKHFISYGDLAGANEADWQKVRYKINHHLGELVEIAADRNCPMLSAIVVQKKNIDNGILDGKTRDGFINAAKEFGFDVSSPNFVEEQQKAMFAWAETAPDKLDELMLLEMKKPSANNDGGPKFVRFFGPLLDALRSLNGSGEPKQVYEKIVESPHITSDDFNATNKGDLKFQYQVRWARFYLAKAGLIDDKKRGIWKLTSEGRDTHLDEIAASDLFRDIHSRFRHTTEEEAEEPPPENPSNDLFDDDKRRFWFVGSIWHENDDQIDRFLKEGIWENGHRDKYAEHVLRMQPGDRIAIKASFTKRYGLPFDSQGKHVACMRVKAVGTIAGATMDGRSVQVDWEPLNESRDWYFYTYRVTVAEADASDEFARRLIQFAFSDHNQDFEFWLSQAYWAKRYRSSASTPTEIDLEKEEDDADLGEAEITPYELNDIIEDGCFLPEEILDSALTSLENKKNLILQGPPGTGKTWLAKRLGYALIGTKNRAVIRKRMRSIQFHPTLSYEDFVRGWRPDGDGKLSLINGVFLESVEAARAEPDRPFVVVIEEINRGNPAQIFGEMLTLLEHDKRREEEAIQLAYHRDRGERIFVPRNLFLIGTMNIADRSLALVDLALRRRFAFVTLEPALNESWMKWCIERAGMDRSVLHDIQKRMNELNDEIAADRSLGSQFRIGHSYVTPRPDDTINDPGVWFRGIVETEIGPLLDEYWFDNPDKIATSKTQLLQGF